MFTKYKLEGKIPVPVEDVLEWARWFHDADRQVARDIIGNLRVSTVFLGLDHNFSLNGPPVLFETMIFPVDAKGEYIRGEALDYMERYTTWELALEGHRRAVAYAKETLS